MFSKHVLEVNVLKAYVWNGVWALFKEMFELNVKLFDLWMIS